VDSVECDAHSGMLKYVFNGADFASYICKFGQIFEFFLSVIGAVVNRVPVGGRGAVLVSS
jgi:hypothetical protein